MRTPHLGDVVAAARALRGVPEAARAHTLDKIIGKAGEALRHGRETGMNHPQHGDGSLMAAALSQPCMREPSLEDADYCRCLALVLLVLASRAEPHEAQPMQRVTVGSRSRRFGAMSSPQESQ